jgi:hypothetical protein
MRFFIGVALALALVSPARAQVAPITTQSCNPNFVNGQFPSPAQWNAPGACAFPNSGGVLGGPIQLPASSSTRVPLVIPHGAPPTAPIPNGAIWTTSAGLFVQINGATVGPLGTGGGVSAPVNSAPPVISGTPQVGQTLTASNGTWTGSPTFADQWLLGGSPISGATGATFVPVTGDIGGMLSVTITATNGGGSTPATSAAVGPITAPPAGGCSSVCLVSRII